MNQPISLRDDDIPVTAGLIDVVMVVRSAAEFYRAETALVERALSEGAKISRPRDYFSRCEELFTDTYGQEAEKAGLPLNRVTFEAILRWQVPGEVLQVAYKDLPGAWVFNPYTGWRKA